MSAVKDGGAAFPVVTGIVAGHDEWGNELVHEVQSTGGNVSVRDYFAAKALAAIMLDQAQLLRSSKPLGMRVVDYAAGLAYEYADAMLRYREVQL